MTVNLTYGVLYKKKKKKEKRISEWAMKKDKNITYDDTEIT